MPRYFFYEESLQWWDEDEQVSKELSPEELSSYDRTPGGMLTQYEPAEASFDTAALEAEEARVHGILRGRGVTQVVVGYDGGNDESFAHFEEALAGDERLPKDELVRELHAGPLGDEPITPYIYYGDNHKPSRAKRARDALDGYAYALASCLLGGGYGTGEHELLGRLRADLLTGRITDHDRPNEPPPYGDEPYPSEDE